MTYRVIIADDEMLARKRLRMMLETKPEYTIVAECANGTETVEAIVQHEPDLVFLDIKMPALDGFDVLEALDAARVPPAIVFVTAFDAYAVKAFERQRDGLSLETIQRQPPRQGPRARGRATAPDRSRAAPADVPRDTEE